jgi:hypothetical protein
MVNARRFPSGPALLQIFIQASRYNSSRAARILGGLLGSPLTALTSLDRKEGLRYDLYRKGKLLSLEDSKFATTSLATCASWNYV